MYTCTVHVWAFVHVESAHMYMYTIHMYMYMCITLVRHCMRMLVMACLRDTGMARHFTCREGGREGGREEGRESEEVETEKKRQRER